jgi:hypothetical protein
MVNGVTDVAGVTRARAAGRRRRVDPGLSIDGDLVVDEAARVSDALYEAARPMLIRHAQTARLILLSTAWARQGFFYRTWTGGDETG